MKYSRTSELCTRGKKSVRNCEMYVTPNNDVTMVFYTFTTCVINYTYSNILWNRYTVRTISTIIVCSCFRGECRFFGANVCARWHKVSIKCQSLPISAAVRLTGQFGSLMFVTLKFYCIVECTRIIMHWFYALDYNWKWHRKHVSQLCCTCCVWGLSYLWKGTWTQHHTLIKALSDYSTDNWIQCTLDACALVVFTSNAVLLEVTHL